MAFSTEKGKKMGGVAVTRMFRINTTANTYLEVIFNEDV